MTDKTFDHELALNGAPVWCGGYEYQDDGNWAEWIWESECFVYYTTSDLLSEYNLKKKA